GDPGPDAYRKLLRAAVLTRPGTTLTEFVQLPRVHGMAQTLKSVPDLDDRARSILRLDADAVVGEPELSRLFWASVKALELLNRVSDRAALETKVLHLKPRASAGPAELLELAAQAAAAGRDLDNPTALGAFHLVTLGAYDPETELVDLQGRASGRNWGWAMTNFKVVDTATAVTSSGRQGAHSAVIPPGLWPRAMYLVRGLATAKIQPTHLHMGLPRSFRGEVPWDEVAELLLHDPKMNGLSLEVDVALTAELAAPPEGPEGSEARKKDPRGVISAAIGRIVHAAGAGISLKNTKLGHARLRLSMNDKLSSIGPRDGLSPADAALVDGKGWSVSAPRGLASSDVSTSDTDEVQLPFADVDGVAAPAAPSIGPAADPGTPTVSPSDIRSDVSTDAPTETRAAAQPLLSSAVSEELGPRSSGFAEMFFTPSLPGFVDDDVLMVDAPAGPSTPIGVRELLEELYGSDIASDEKQKPLYEALLAAVVRLNGLRQVEPVLRDGPFDLDALDAVVRHVFMLDTAVKVAAEHRGPLFWLAMDERAKSASSLAVLSALHLQRVGALAPEYALETLDDKIWGRDLGGVSFPVLDLNLSGTATRRPDGTLEFGEVGPADWHRTGEDPPFVIRAEGGHDHVMVFGRRVSIDVFVELMAIDPAVAALPAGVEVLLCISGAGARQVELARRVADRLGRPTWSTNGTLHEFALPEDPSLRHVIYLEVGDPADTSKLRPEWILSPPGLLPDPADTEADRALDRALLSNTVVDRENLSTGRSFFGPGEEKFAEQDRHARTARETWHRDPVTGILTKDPHGVPFGDDVYTYGVHGRESMTTVATEKNPKHVLRDGAFGGVLRRRPSLKNLDKKYKVVGLACLTPRRGGTTHRSGMYGPAPFVPDPLAVTSELQHVANETGRVSFGVTAPHRLMYNVAEKKWAHVLDTDVRGRRGRWVEIRPESSGDALDDRARVAGLHTGDGPVSVEDRERALRLVRALREAFGVAIEDHSEYEELLRGIGALEIMRAADPALNGFGPFTMDLFDRAAHAHVALVGGQIIVDGDPGPDAYRALLESAAATTGSGTTLTEFVQLPAVVEVAQRLEGTADLVAEARNILRLDADAVVGKPELSRLFWASVKAQEFLNRVSDTDALAIVALHLKPRQLARPGELFELAAQAADAGRDLDNRTALAAFHLETLGAYDPETELVDSQGGASGRNWAWATVNAKEVDTAETVVERGQGIGKGPLISTPWPRGVYLVRGLPPATVQRNPPYLKMSLPGGFTGEVPWAQVAELLLHDPELNKLDLEVDVALTVGMAAPELGSEARKNDPRSVISAAIGRIVHAAHNGIRLEKVAQKGRLRPRFRLLLKADKVKAGLPPAPSARLEDLAAAVGPRDMLSPADAALVDGAGWSDSAPRGLASPDVSTPDTEDWLPFADADGVAAPAPSPTSAHTFTPSIAPVPDPGAPIGQDSAMDVPYQPDSDDTASSFGDRSDTESMFGEASGVSSNVSDYGSDDEARQGALTADSPPAVGGRDGTGKGTAQLLGGDPDRRDAVGPDARMLSSEEDPEQGRAERGAASEVSPLSSAVSEELGPRSSGFAEMSFTPSLPGFVDDDVLMVDAPAEPSTPIGVRELLEDLYGSDITSDEGKKPLYDALLAAVDLLDRLRQVEPVLRDGPFELDAVVRHVFMLDTAVEVAAEHRGPLFWLAMDERAKSASSLAVLSALHLQRVGALAPEYALETLDGKIWGRDLGGVEFPVLDLTLSGTATRRPDGTLEFGDVGPADWHRTGKHPFVIRAEGGYDHVMVFGRRVSIDVFVELMAIDPAVVGVPAGGGLPAVAGLPVGVEVLLCISGAGARQVELARRVADRLGRPTWSTNGTVHEHGDPALPSVIYLEVGDPAGTRKLRPVWILSPPGLLPDPADTEADRVLDRELLSNTVVDRENLSTGRSFFGPGEEAFAEQDRHARTARETWHRNPVTGILTKDDDDVPFGEFVYSVGAHGREGSMRAPTEKNPSNRLRDGAFGGVLRRRPSLQNLAKKYKVAILACFTPGRIGTTLRAGSYGPVPFVPDPLAVTSELQHISNETGRVSFGATAQYRPAYNLAEKKWVHVLDSDVRGRRGRWVELRPEPSGDELDDRARVAGLHTGDGPVSVEDRERALRLVRALRLAFGVTIEDHSEYDELWRGICALETMRAADSALNGFGPFTMDLLERAARVGRAQLSDSVTLVDSDPRSDAHRDLRTACRALLHRAAAPARSGIALTEFVQLPSVSGVAQVLKSALDLDGMARSILRLDEGAVVGKPELSRLFWASVKAVEWSSRVPYTDVLAAEVLHLRQQSDSPSDLLELVTQAAAAGRDVYNPTALGAFHLEMLGAFDPETELVDPQGGATGRNWDRTTVNDPKVVDTAKTVTSRYHSASKPLTPPPWPRGVYLVRGIGATQLTVHPYHLHMRLRGRKVMVPWAHVGEVLRHDPKLNGLGLDVDVALTIAMAAPPTGPEGSEARKKDPRGVISAAIGRIVHAAHNGIMLDIADDPGRYLPHLKDKPRAGLKRRTLAPFEDLVSAIGPRDDLSPADALLVDGKGWSDSAPRGPVPPDLSRPDQEAEAPAAGVAAPAGDDVVRPSVAGRQVPLTGPGFDGTYLRFEPGAPPSLVRWGAVEPGAVVPLTGGKVAADTFVVTPGVGIAALFRGDKRLPARVAISEQAISVRVDDTVSFYGRDGVHLVDWSDGDEPFLLATQIRLGLVRAADGHHPLGEHGLLVEVDRGRAVVNGDTGDRTHYAVRLLDEHDTETDLLVIMPVGGSIGSKKAVFRDGGESAPDKVRMAKDGTFTVKQGGIAVMDAPDAEDGTFTVERGGTAVTYAPDGRLLAQRHELPPGSAGSYLLRPTGGHPKVHGADGLPLPSASAVDLGDAGFLVRLPGETDLVISRAGVHHKVVPLVIGDKATSLFVIMPVDGRGMAAVYSNTTLEMAGQASVEPDAGWIIVTGDSSSVHDLTGTQLFDARPINGGPLNGNFLLTSVNGGPPLVRSSEWAPIENVTASQLALAPGMFTVRTPEGSQVVNGAGDTYTMITLSDESGAPTGSLLLTSALRGRPSTLFVNGRPVDHRSSFDESSSFKLGRNGLFEFYNEQGRLQRTVFQVRGPLEGRELRVVLPAGGTPYMVDPRGTRHEVRALRDVGFLVQSDGIAMVVDRAGVHTHRALALVDDVVVVVPVRGRGGSAMAFSGSEPAGPVRVTLGGARIELESDGRVHVFDGSGNELGDWPGSLEGPMADNSLVLSEDGRPRLLGANGVTVPHSSVTRLLDDRFLVHAPGHFRVVVNESKAVTHVVISLGGQTAAAGAFMIVPVDGSAGGIEVFRDGERTPDLARARDQDSFEVVGEGGGRTAVHDVDGWLEGYIHSYTGELQGLHVYIPQDGGPPRLHGLPNPEDGEPRAVGLFNPEDGGPPRLLSHPALGRVTPLRGGVFLIERAEGTGAVIDRTGAVTHHAFKMDDELGVVVTIPVRAGDPVGRYQDGVPLPERVSVHGAGDARRITVWSADRHTVYGPTGSRLHVVHTPRTGPLGTLLGGNQFVTYGDDARGRVRSPVVWQADGAVASNVSVVRLPDECFAVEVDGRVGVVDGNGVYVPHISLTGQNGAVTGTFVPGLKVVFRAGDERVDRAQISFNGNRIAVERDGTVTLHDGNGNWLGIRPGSLGGPLRGNSLGYVGEPGRLAVVGADGQSVPGSSVTPLQPDGDLGYLIQVGGVLGVVDEGGAFVHDVIRLTGRNDVATDTFVMSPVFWPGGAQLYRGDGESLDNAVEIIGSNSFSVARDGGGVDVYDMVGRLLRSGYAIRSGPLQGLFVHLPEHGSDMWVTDADGSVVPDASVVRFGNVAFLVEANGARGLVDIEGAHIQHGTVQDEADQPNGRLTASLDAYDGSPQPQEYRWLDGALIALDDSVGDTWFYDTTGSPMGVVRVIDGGPFGGLLNGNRLVFLSGGGLPYVVDRDGDRQDDFTVTRQGHNRFLIEMDGVRGVVDARGVHIDDIIPPQRRNVVRSAFDVRRFTHGGESVTDLTVRLAFHPGDGRVDTEAVMARVRQGVEWFYNRPGSQPGNRAGSQPGNRAGYKLPNGDRLHVTVEPVGPDDNPHLTVEFVGRDKRMNQRAWWADADPVEFAHELAHQLFLRDETRNASNPNRLHAPGSLLGPFDEQAPDGLAQSGLRERHLHLWGAVVGDIAAHTSPEGTSWADARRNAPAELREQVWVDPVSLPEASPQMEPDGSVPPPLPPGRGLPTPAEASDSRLDAVSETPSLPGFQDGVVPDDVAMVDAPAELTAIEVEVLLEALEAVHGPLVEELYGSDITSDEKQKPLYDALLAAVAGLDRLRRAEPVLRDGPFNLVKLNAVVRHVFMLDTAVEVAAEHRGPLFWLAMDERAKSASSLAVLSALHLQRVGALAPEYALETLDRKIWGRDLGGVPFPVLDLTLSGTAIRRSDGTLEFGEVGPADWH
ncbi:lonely Cys domain-containing protein, partial [Streptomyces sp. NPDC102441]|uniref:lonely Cys domain-containing protein n=1 Tax=Streptomyces sp. NPDC102441 TaxID=3366176 RepID=UPI0037FE9E32